VFLLPVLFATSSAGAGVELSFPLGQHYRAGRYVPVRIVATDVAGRDLTLGGPGAVPVEISVESAHADVLVPMLVVTSIETITCAISGGGGGVDAKQALTALGRDERLVGMTTVGPESQSLVADLFPGMRIRNVALSPTDPMPGPPLAWGALDAVLLDSAGAARMTDEQVATLVAAGTTVAVRNEGRPRGDWPWHRHGSWWLARADPAGPRDVIEMAAYEPVAGRDFGWSQSFRKTVVLVCAGFSAAALAASLWRSRRSWIIVVAVGIASAGALAWWRAGQRPSRSALGAVVVESAAWVQSDEWSYDIAIATGDAEPRWVLHDRVVAPIFASERHYRAVDVSLNCRSDGTPEAFRQRLIRDQRLAFLSREVWPRPADQSGNAAHAPEGESSPLLRLAEDLYMRAGDRIKHGRGTGHTAVNGWDVWPQVVIERDANTDH
jgi:hypothetical protein